MEKEINTDSLKEAELVTNEVKFILGSLILEKIQISVKNNLLQEALNNSKKKFSEDNDINNNNNTKS